VEFSIQLLAVCLQIDFHVIIPCRHISTILSVWVIIRHRLNLLRHHALTVACLLVPLLSLLALLLLSGAFLLASASVVVPVVRFRVTFSLLALTLESHPANTVVGVPCHGLSCAPLLFFGPGALALASICVKTRILHAVVLVLRWDIAAAGCHFVARLLALTSFSVEAHAGFTAVGAASSALLCLFTAARLFVKFLAT